MQAMEKINMQGKGFISALTLGLCIFFGLVTAGWLAAKTAIEVKQFERSVTVKGLSEREYQADIVIWPIQFTVANNDLQSLYGLLDSNTAKIKRFLTDNGLPASEISVGSPAIHDKSAQQYGNSGRADYRYTAYQSVTVYSKNITKVRALMAKLSELGKQDIVLTASGYQSSTEYIYTQLNAVKPEMVEEATKKAREVAEKFASDSNSILGKIKRASQGQFSISARDNNNPHIKKVRVVSTVEYYLSD